MKKILMFFFALVILTACSSEKNHYDYTFNGESENWKAQYSFNGTEVWGTKDGRTTYSNDNNDEFVLTYKRSLTDFSSVKSLEYSYETSAGGGGGTRQFDGPPTEVTFKNMGRAGNGAKISEDEVIQVNVKWNDMEESFELHASTN